MTHTQETLPPETPFVGFEAAAESTEALSQRLEAGTEYAIGINEPLATDEKYGCGIAAIITTDGNLAPGQKYADGTSPDSFILLDLRKQPTVKAGGHSHKVFGKDLIDSSVDFMLVNKLYGEEDNVGYKGIRLGESLHVGRRNHELDKRFGFASTTSGNHFTLRYDTRGQLTIEDHNSTNGTNVTTTGLRQHHQWQTREEQEKAFRPPEEPKQEQTYGLDEQNQLKLEELQRKFAGEISRGEIDNALMAGMLKHIGNLREQGVVDDKIWKQIARSVHPDRAAAGSAEHVRRVALFKALNDIMHR